MGLFLKKNRFFSKILKKKINLLFLKKNFLKHTYNNSVFKKSIPVDNIKEGVFLKISQKNNNPKGTISRKLPSFTFSVGSIIKFFKISYTKYLRRSFLGLKIFFNVFKNIFEKKFFFLKNYNLIFCISGFDFNLLRLKKQIKNFFKKNTKLNVFIVFNLKISFTKVKNKKVKSLKKRLKKKIVLGFAKGAKIYNNI